MSLLGIDIAWDRPTIAEIKGTGAQWVARYLSTDPTKNLTAQEVKDYPANGLSIVIVWETTTCRAGQGKQAGIDDAHAAISQRSILGLPADMPIHFAVDEDISWAGVEAYFQGVVSILGANLTGVYGGYQVIQGAHSFGLTYLWQTVAWSNGQWSPYATIRQPATTTLNGGADYDNAEVPDFGQYPRPINTGNGGTDLPTPQDVWAYKGPGDSPDVHQTVQNIATQVKSDGAQLTAIKTELDAVKTELDAVKTAIAGVTNLKLTDAQVTALVSQIVPVLVPQLLTAMGQKLDK